MPVNQTKDMLWPDPKGTVQITGLTADEQEAILTPTAPTTTVIQLCSHNNKLLALTNNGQIWWFNYPGAGSNAPVQWVEMWDPANPGMIPNPTAPSL
jgi:hypothetical protein